MILTIEELERITGRIEPHGAQHANAVALLDALNKYGAKFGLDRPHRLAIYLGQMLHESAALKYDREIWGPTEAQKRYDIRTDLGNTPERDGDGAKYKGRSPIQITGKSNYRQFRDWCRDKISRAAPDFVAEPEKVNTDPWEGLGPIWYWSTRNLNRWADDGDVKQVTRRINGGYNGLADRQWWTDRSSLVLLGFGPQSVKKYQKTTLTLEVDGKMGPKTRAVMHRELSAKPARTGEKAPRLAPIVPGGQAGGAVAGGLITAGLAALTAFWQDVQEAACSLPLINLLCGG